MTVCCEEYYSVNDLRNELEGWDGEMELVIIDEHGEEREVSGVEIWVRGKEPKLRIKID